MFGFDGLHTLPPPHHPRASLRLTHQIPGGPPPQCRSPLRPELDHIHKVFPISAFLRFTDNSDLRVVNENRTLQPEQRHVFGPFPAIPGRRTNQVNVRVGATKMPASTGFSYRVSVEGCD
ncbi:MAG: hypothetical protein RLZZ274_1563 [Cyanobacteriota bacterium]